jgi:hypothetical protein
MTMQHSSDALIAELVSELEPVRPLRLGEGLALALAAAGVTALLVAWLAGLRADLMAGQISPMALVANGLYLGLGLAASATVVIMSRPQIGSDHSGWRWAAGMAGLLPLAGAIVAIGRGTAMRGGEGTAHELWCVAAGMGVSLLVFAALTLWLRRGAPTSPERAGLVTGIAAGAFGIAAFSLHCADDDIVHLGLWHGAVVAVMGALGRAIIPRLIRW